MSDEHYYKKYLKYKNKYLQLKNQEGGIGLLNPGWSYAYDAGYMLMTPGELEIYELNKNGGGKFKVKYFFKQVQKLIPTFKLTSLTTLGVPNDFIFGKKRDRINTIFAEGKDVKFNELFIKEYQRKFGSTIKDNKSKLVIFIIYKNYQIISSLNFNKNQILHDFALLL